MKYYTDEHLWIDITDRIRWEIGITAKGEELLAGFSYADLADNETLTVEGVKSVYDIHIPVMGGKAEILPMPINWEESIPLAVITGERLTLENGVLPEKEYRRIYD